MQGPVIFKAEMFHFLPGLLGCQTSKMNFVQGSDQARSVAADVAMKINRPKAFVGQQTENLTHMRFRRGDRRRVDRLRNYFHSIFLRLFFFEPVKERKEL